MRQSRKEAKLERMAHESLHPERREAIFFMEMAPPAEFADEFLAQMSGGFRGGRRPLPGGRG